MPELVEFQLADGSSVLVQTESAAMGTESAGPAMRGFRERTHAESAGGGSMAVRQAERGFEQAVQAVRPAAEALVEQLRALAGGPREVTIEFGLQMSAQAGAFIAQAASAANFKVTLHWKREHDEPTAGQPLGQGSAE